jgi:hypothetical protein
MKLIERSSQRLILQNENHPQIARTSSRLCLVVGGLLTLFEPVMQLFPADFSIDRQLPSSIFYVVAVGLIALGVWIISTASTTKVLFDRHQSRLQIIWYCFLKNSTYTCCLHEIVDVKLEKSITSYNRPLGIEYGADPDNLAIAQEYVVWRINLILASGHSLPLTQQFNSDTQNGEDIRQLFSYVQEFLAGQPCLNNRCSSQLLMP